MTQDGAQALPTEGGAHLAPWWASWPNREAACLSGGPLALRRLVLLPTIYTVDFKTVLGRLIQRWSKELTRIDDVAIPCPLLHLDSLLATPPRLYIPTPTSLPRTIPETLIHIILVSIRASSQDVEVE
jgi:hypothetical protein